MTSALCGVTALRRYGTGGILVRRATWYGRRVVEGGHTGSWGLGSTRVGNMIPISRAALFFLRAATLAALRHTGSPSRCFAMCPHILTSTLPAVTEHRDGQSDHQEARRRSGERVALCANALTRCSCPNRANFLYPSAAVMLPICPLPSVYGVLHIALAHPACSAAAHYTSAPRVSRHSGTSRLGTATVRHSFLIMCATSLLSGEASMSGRVWGAMSVRQAAVLRPPKIPGPPGPQGPSTPVLPELLFLHCACRA